MYDQSFQRSQATSQQSLFIHSFSKYLVKRNYMKVTVLFFILTVGQEGASDTI